MQKVSQKLKIDLEEKLPNPSAWDIKEFSKYLNKVNNDKNDIKFLDEYYFCCNKINDHPYKFERKVIKEFEENINKRALEDLKRLGLILIKKI